MMVLLMEKAIMRGMNGEEFYSGPTTYDLVHDRVIDYNSGGNSWGP